MESDTRQGYRQKISSNHPGLVVMVLDDSGSMDGVLPGGSDKKHVWTERYTGHIFDELFDRSNDPISGSVKPRFYFYTIIYGSSLKTWPAGSDAEHDIEQVVRAYQGGGNAGLGLGGTMGGTDTLAAFEHAHRFLSGAVTRDRFNQSFPPMVFHLTDSLSRTDARPIAERIRGLETADGNVLVANALIGPPTNLGYTGPADFPGYVDDQEAGPSQDSIKLFQMSSTIPDAIHATLVAEGVFPALRPNARLYFDVRTQEMLKHVFQLVESLGDDRMLR